MMNNEEAIINASLDIKMIRDIILTLGDKNGQMTTEQQMSYRNNLKEDKWGNGVFTKKKKVIGDEDYNEEDDNNDNDNENDIFDHSSDSSSSDADATSNSESEVSASLNQSKGTH